MKPLKIIWLYHARTLAWGYTLLILFLLLSPTPSVEGIIPRNIQYDKLIHFAIFAVYYLVLSIVFSPGGGKALLLAFAFAFSTEVFQRIIPYRSGEFRDFVANSIGIISSYLYVKIRQ